MTPRTVVLMLQQDLNVGDVLTLHKLLPYSRIPVYGESADDIKGYVLRHEIYKRAAADEHHIIMHDIALDLDVVPETNSVAQVLDEFIAKQDHIFLVIDEYGGTAGLITLEDTVETLLGIEIRDESDRVTDMRLLAKRRYESQLDLMQKANDALASEVDLEDKPQIPREGD